MNVEQPQRPLTRSWRRRIAVLKKHVVANFLPLAFAVAIIVAMSWPEPGRAVAAPEAAGVHIIQAINTFLVFLVSGLTLKLTELKDAFRSWLAAAYALIAILGITPCLGFAARSLKMQPAEFNTGLAIFCCMPTTLGVGVALTAAAKGNQTLALFLTVSTNMLAIATVPFILQGMLQGSRSISIDPANLIVKLILTVLVPTILGVAARALSPPISAFVIKHKVSLTVFSHINLAMIIWQTLSGAREILISQQFDNIVLIIIAGLVMHLIYLTFNGIVTYLLRVPAKEAIAVLIMASQKSAPVAVTVIVYVGDDLATQGLLAIPSIVGQLVQIFLGSFLVHFLARYVKEPQE